MCDLGGSGGASKQSVSGQEFRKGEVPSVGVMDMACLRSRGDGGFVRDLSLEWVGFGGSGISQGSESLDFIDGKLELLYSKGPLVGVLKSE